MWLHRARILVHSSSVHLRKVVKGLPSWAISTNKNESADELDYFKMGKLADYLVPDKVIATALNRDPPDKFLERIKRWSADNSLTRAGKNTYIEAFRTMIYFEELAEKLQVEKFNLNDVQLHHVEGNEFLFFFKSEMEGLCVAIDNNQFNRFVLRSKNDDGGEINGSILGKAEDKIHVLLFEGIETFAEDKLYDINFQINRLPYQVQHKALDFVQHHKLFDVLIENPKYTQTESEMPQETARFSDTQLSDDLLETLNQAQKQAVIQITKGEYYPLPYLIYGPAGTGKTKTLVAAIKNIVETSQEHILVCAQSNAACDEIAERLGECLEWRQMFRMYATSQRPDRVSPSLREVSNIYNGMIDYPPLKYLRKYRVVICTLATAGCLARAQCSPNHFSYVFIDECASTPESMALVSIAGLCTTIEEVHAKIVLAGDPKQLDAVTKSEWATKLGYSVSWLERLFSFPLYQRDSKTGTFNSKYVTQLIENYRSHPAILHISNQLFYEGSLVAKAKPEIINFNIHPQLNPKFPIVFKSVQGTCEKDVNDTSSFNMEEIEAVMEFIDAILKSNSIQIKPIDIGVVSPYKLQCKKIIQACKAKELNDITVGTSEVFQGQERKVMIVSTVRSQGYLGQFVSDPQRFNVMITRPINLLIVVGDPHTLRKDPNWLKFINYCYENDGFIQSTRTFRYQTQRS